VRWSRPLLLIFFVPVLAWSIGSVVKPAQAEGVQKASLAMNIQPLGYLFKDGRHRYTHHRVFIESAGIGVTLTSGKVCVNQGKECVSGKLNYRIDANSTKSRRNQYVATKSIPDVATVEYDGVDDNGNAVHVEAELILDIPQ